MKTAKIILLLMLSLFLPIEIAATPDQKENDPKSKETLLKNETPPSRPKKPSNYFIECRYGKGFIELGLPDGIEMVFVSLKQGGVSVWEGMAFSDDSWIEIPELKGQYVIECRTEDGRIFTGELYF